MKNIRIWFQKVNTAKYISHLDLCRCMERAIHKARLPFWYTEGFNPHVFLTITMPISLGYTGLRESMDVKLLDDDTPYEEIVKKLNSGLPKDIHVFEITEPKMKPGAVAFSAYEVTLDTEHGLALQEKIQSLLSSTEILVLKRTKKGQKEMDILPFFREMLLDSPTAGQLRCRMMLPSSNLGSINPKLFFDVLAVEDKDALFPQTVRTDCFDESLVPFA